MNKKILYTLIVSLIVISIGIIGINIKFNSQDLKNNPIINSVISTHEKDILYFAYGSNMNLNQMNNRCPNGFKKFKNSLLDDYILGFDKSGYANIKEDKESYLLGVLYYINDECLKSLDGYEGYPTHYNRLVVDIYDFDTRTHLKP
jgi:gamma-glutamylcyclotransferase (GGCT)/AIG2-like uncharacterized protein YtfP